MYDTFFSKNVSFDPCTILGSAITATFLFIFGGISLISLLSETLLRVLGLAQKAVEPEQRAIIFEVVEYVHTILIGTVL